MYNAVLYGFKGSGKTAVGRMLAKMLDRPFLDSDAVIESLHAERAGESLTFRHIYEQRGEEYFRELEREAVKECAGRLGVVLAVGGSAFRDPDNRRALRERGVFVYLETPPDVLADRIRGNVPSFLDPEDLEASIRTRNAPFLDLYRAHADVLVCTADADVEECARRVLGGLQQHAAVMVSSPNTFGTMVRMHTFGESHGPAVGVVIDGVPSGIELDIERIQHELDRRRPGQSEVTTRRSEKDHVHVMSGLFEGKTTGTPICLLIYNEEKDSSAYDALRDVFRPGHADFTYFAKYGIRDHRGGGRSSGRETAARVAAGAIALSELERRGIRITGHVLEAGGVQARTFDPQEIEKNPVRAADAEAARRMVAAITSAREEGNSVGGVVEIIASGVPAGLGEPVFYKLDAMLAQAVVSIGAVKGVEFGSGFEAAGMRGTENNDEMTEEGFASNNAGGILGGISTGQEVVLRFAVKPTASVSQPQETIDRYGRQTTLKTEGRHDPCIAPRVVPVAESMTAWVLWNALLWQQRMAHERTEDQNVL
ncbi:MAG: chorismate synthase [Planctomycetota bacterium]